MATVYDLRRELARRRVRRSGTWFAYERGKRTMAEWREAHQGEQMPTYDRCLQAVTEWVRV